MEKILKLENDGEDFGYVKLDQARGVFCGDGKREEAVTFELIKCKGSLNRHYFKMAYTDLFMDVAPSSSKMQLIKLPFGPVGVGVCAWELGSDSKLRMILENKFTGKCLGLSTDDRRSKILYGSLQGLHCKVTIEDAY